GAWRTAWSLRRLTLNRDRLLRDRGRQRWPNDGSRWRRRHCRPPVARRSRLRRRHGGGHCPGLAAPIGNWDCVRRVGDDDFVVNVDEDYVVRRRWRYVSRRANPNRNRRVDRNRQHEYGHGRWWRRQHHELGWRRREEDDRRRWRRHEREHRIIEDKNR